MAATRRKANFDTRVAEDAPSKHVPSVSAGPDADEDDEEEEWGLPQLQSFANRVQYSTSDSNGAGPSSIRPKIVIPKRGEKDFEPLEETVNLQDMMLQRSREALFSALLGVRGGNIQSISQAVLLPPSPYPRIQVVRGHLMDSIGISVSGPPRASGKKRQTYTELLPEEALYLLERGSLQIWITNGSSGALGDSDPVLNEKEYGFENSTEMSVMQGFSTFLGKDDLTWERYQSYTYLKRLGYTVQRSRRFLPKRFLASDRPKSRSDSQPSPALPPFRTWWLSLPMWFNRSMMAFGRLFSCLLGSLRAPAHMIPPSALHGWSGRTYGSIGLHLHWSPAEHSHTVRPRIRSSGSHATPMDNPYIPFWHVWKPDRPWSKAKWDKGSEVGLSRQPFDFAIAAIDARHELLPSLAHLNEVFDELPDEKIPPPRNPQPNHRSSGGSGQTRKPRGPALPTPGRSVPSIRNGDRAFVVAVSDSGNIGWVRFGRTGFASVFDM